MTQLGVNAGLSARQLPGLAKGFLTISDATGLAATNVAHMAYYLASANPALKTTTSNCWKWPARQRTSTYWQALLRPRRPSPAYGAIVSNAMSLTGGAGHSPTRRRWQGDQ